MREEMVNSGQDERFMRLALQEAKKGLGRTSPNPCVGAVIVKGDRIIAKGYHKKAGQPHAEINAIRQATETVVGATLYVTLEPCNHTGKTPPCSKAIVESGISRVVIGMSDPNPMVNGAGINFLRVSGVSVSSGLLEQECQAINYPFIKHVTTGMPWVIMKAGVSLDGRLNYQRGKDGWITGAKSGLEVHRLRNRVDAVVVGGRTVEIDNPSLTTRLNRGRAKDPVRVVADCSLSTSLSAKVYQSHNSPAPTWVFHGADAPPERIARFQAAGIRLFPIARQSGGLHLRELLMRLGREGICSVVVEGGARLHGAFLREQLYDYAHLFYAPLIAGDAGVSLVEGYQGEDRQHAPRLAFVCYKKLDEDMLVSGRLVYHRTSS
jgi:diaminohydroxyphosphoribosylaminopyrimidine deaminase / 5-amino-6-(5-phosphoribosylamino)uracil reductase